MLNLKKCSACLLCTALLLSFAACSSEQTPASESSSAPLSSAQASSANPKSISEVEQFIADNVPEDYTADATYTCTVEDSGNGSFNVSLTLNNASNGASPEEFSDMIAFEAQYLAEELFASAPHKVNFYFSFLMDGEEFGTVIKLHDAGSYRRTVGDKTDDFRFQ